MQGTEPKACFVLGKQCTADLHLQVHYLPKEVVFTMPFLGFRINVGDENYRRCFHNSHFPTLVCMTV